jgi:predicted DCC family thiol-disulfide oxidoreductase YuxK
VTHADHLILFDGVCALCHWVVRFVIARDSRHVFDFAPLDSDVGRSFLNRPDPPAQEADTIYLVSDYRSAHPTRLSKGRAATRIAHRLDWPWCWLGAADVLPAAVLDWLYDVVARHRYAMFGRYDVCPVPRPEHRGRFI